MSKLVGSIKQLFGCKMRLFFGVVVIGAFSLVFGNAGVFTDSRDGQTYRTIRIGNFTWMAQNLNFQTGNSWCYDNNENNCQKLGRLYDWNTAMVACPADWRLPTREDWNDLVETAGGNVAGTRLKSRSPDWNGTDNFGFSAWNGTDNFGFSALPGGRRSPNGRFFNVGDYGIWWSATELGFGIAFGSAWCRRMSSYHGRVDEFKYHESNGLSVLCLQD